MTSRSKKNIKVNTTDKAYIFPALFDTTRTKAGSFIVSFEIDESLRELTNGIADNAMGTNFVLVAYRIATDSELADVMKQPGETNEKFDNFNHAKLLRQLHAIVGTYAEEMSIDNSIVKNALKSILVAEGLIEESISELDDGGLARAIFILRTKMRPDIFDYFTEIT
jgi:hypothetical protein